ncbi:BTB/POZ domain-containing protein [Ananas comosus]|uniref:BTB/POZ domain-containing protein n=1 Tax=Ananas comosus TaxID=4615 RepID=A0A199W9L0_ANACO|nr:BTB/POZ domain-containing protein [Ananas comosus]
MADFRVRRLESRHTKIRNVPIAVTPEGFWCCPSQAVLQKTLKNQNHQNKQKGSSPPSKAPSVQRAPAISSEKRASTPTRSKGVSDDQKCPPTSDNPALSPMRASERPPKPNSEGQKHKISVGFGQQETSDLKVILYGKEGIAVKMSVHKNILAENSNYFAEKLSRESPVSCIEILDCEDVEIYVETVGLMYCKEVKHRLIKQSVPRVLRILKVAESLGFRACMKSCLDYLEAVPWVGDEEEENVVSSVRHLKTDNYGINPILKRVSSDLNNPPNHTLAHIMELVLKSSDERGRREMKSLVLKLLKENSICNNGSSDICVETLYNSCKSCLDSLLALFREATEPAFSSRALDGKEPITRHIALEADNLLWLVEILADRHVADEFVLMWASQNELSQLHNKLPIMNRHLISCITARIFVGIGRGEVLPCKETRQLLLNVWLQPLIDDYSWLQHGCRSFDRKVIEEGIGRTILTLPLEDQQTILLSWLGSFLKIGDNCPNLQRAFENLVVNAGWKKVSACLLRGKAKKLGPTQIQDPMTSKLQGNCVLEK